MVGVFVAVALIVISILDIIGIARDPADALPFHYVHNVWNLFFGVLMIFMDAPAKWLGKQAAWQTALWQKGRCCHRKRGFVGSHILAICGCLRQHMSEVKHRSAKWIIDLVHSRIAFCGISGASTACSFQIVTSYATAVKLSRGRALVHFYVGVINLAMVNWSPFTLWTKHGSERPTHQLSSTHQMPFASDLASDQLLLDMFRFQT